MRPLISSVIFTAMSVAIVGTPDAQTDHPAEVQTVNPAAAKTVNAAIKLDVKPITRKRRVVRVIDKPDTYIKSAQSQKGVIFDTKDTAKFKMIKPAAKTANMPNLFKQ